MAPNAPAPLWVRAWFAFEPAEVAISSARFSPVLRVRASNAPEAERSGGHLRPALEWVVGIAQCLLGNVVLVAQWQLPPRRRFRR